MLLIEHLTYSFGSHKVLNKLSLHIERGQIVTVLGASGSGKSTLFNLITGILKPTSGLISVNGCPQNISYKMTSYMMQDDLLLPWRSVFDNLALINELGHSKIPNVEFAEEIHHFLDVVGLSKAANLYPHQLSGGMRQRVSLARALLEKRPLLLLDEPFANLDVTLKEQMHELLRKIREKYGTTIVFITHDFRDAAANSDRILMLKNGRIYEEWTTQDNSIEQNGTLLQELKQSLLP